MADILPATQFLKDYNLQNPIGEGGYGSVYLAVNIRTRQQVAVKIMEDSKIENRSWCQKNRRQLPNEIVLWEVLQHDNIHALIAVYYCCDNPAKWYLVMEYDAGFVDLFTYIDVNGAMSTHDSAVIVKQLVLVCYYIAMEGIDHRDLKDENILYNPKTKQIKLIDFGSAAELSSKSYTSFRGTDVYIPPEYYQLGAYSSFSAVVWAIGCLSYIMLDGDCPFQSQADIRNFTSAVNLKPELSTRTFRHNFIKSCLNPDPDGRILFSDLLVHPWLQRV